MAAYMYIAEAKYNGAHLIFIWEKNEACPGHFLSVFEPLENVIFAKNESRYVLDKYSKINYENSNAVFSWIMKMNGIPKNRFGQPSWAQIEYAMYAKYFPTREIMFKALAFVQQHQMCNASAMHIRETDMAASLSKGGKKKASLAQFAQFVESRPAAEPVFLLTDNPTTQQHFLTRYGPQKILVYGLLDAPINRLPLSVSNGSDLMVAGGNASDHRFSTLEHTLLDVVIAAHAKVFRPSGFSSLSELVALLHRLGREQRGWCA